MRGRWRQKGLVSGDGSEKAKVTGWQKPEESFLFRGERKGESAGKLRDDSVGTH